MARVLVGWLLASGTARGETTASEKAAAEALFQEGTDLMAKQSFPEACAKFEASHAIEPGLGVKLWLADCYDRAGRSASAWALFSEAAAMAQKTGQTEREHAANQRATELSARLSKLELHPPEGGLPQGSGVSLDGADIPAGSVGSALPVDPGRHVIVVHAPGYRSATLEQTAPDGPATTVLDLPALSPAPREAARSDARVAQPPRAAHPGALQRAFGYASGGLGVAALAGGGFIAYRAYALNQESLDHCLTSEPNACDTRGAALRGQAQRYGNVATATLIAGGALAATGLVLLFTAPSGEEVRVGAQVSPTGANFVLRGAL